MCRVLVTIAARQKPAGLKIRIQLVAFLASYFRITRTVNLCDLKMIVTMLTL